MKRTLIVGASPKPERYSNKAVRKLVQAGYVVVPYGIRAGHIGDLPIITDWPLEDEEIHTISIYIRAIHQKDIYDKILGLNPQRIIFNPGTENQELYNMAVEKGIEVLNACTLVMLSIGNY